MLIVRGLRTLPVANHFTSPSHSYTDLSVLGRLHCRSEATHKLNEQHLIFRLDNLQPNGMNNKYSNFR